jgi:excisionase family DNA binding protein
MPSPTLSLDEAAERLGVHYQTVYRWVRAGRLPATKIDGRYAIAPADLQAVVQKKGAPVPPPPPGARRLERHGEAIEAALVHGDETEARRIVRRLVDDGASMKVVIQQVLAPPLAHIGEAWRNGEVSIFVEHRASAIVERVLGDHSPNPRGRRRGTAVVAALSGDRHSLPTLMATTALREDNWRVEHLGADLPVDVLDAFVDSHAVDLVVLSATGTDQLERALDVGADLAREGRAVVVGGGGQTLDDLQLRARESISR